MTVPTILQILKRKRNQSGIEHRERWEREGEREMGEGGREGRGGGGRDRERKRCFVPPVEQIKFNHSK